MAGRIYLSLEDVLHIHQDQIQSYGGAVGISDQGLILSALLRPQTGYYDDLIAEAAALWESLTLNHGFVDGNKRVAFASTIVFLAANGLGLNETEANTIEFIDRHLKGGTFRMSVLEPWLRERALPYSAPEPR